jgi:uncharacterized protein
MRLAGVTGWAVGHARLVLALAAVLAIGGVVLALRLDTDAGTDTLVDDDDPVFRATEDFKRKFGDDAVVVLVKGDLRNLVLTENLGRLLRLEGCLSGRVPKGESALPGVCTQIAKLNPTHVVYGPATFINQAAVQIESVLRGQVGSALARARQAGRAARREAADSGLDSAGQDQAASEAVAATLQQFQQDLIRLALEHDVVGEPRINDPRFVSQIVFDSRLPEGAPKARFSYLFPTARSALISVRLRPGLSDAERSEAVDLFRRAVADRRFALDKGTYVVSGVPAVVDGLSTAIRDAVPVLLLAAVLAMAITLRLVFHSRRRLLPLAVALVAAGMVFAALALLGGTLTMASIAVLPVLIGLAVDYAIQFQARFDESRAAGVDLPQAARAAARVGGPVIGTAALASAAGFAVLYLSPTPMVRTFGLMLVLGVGLAFIGALTAGFAAMTISGATHPPGEQAPTRLEGAARARLERAGRGATSLFQWAGERLRGAGTRALAVAIAAPGRVLVLAAALALVGWVAGTRTEVVSDVRELVPRDLPALRDVNELQATTGVSGELNVEVVADDITDPAVVTWMRDFEDDVLQEHGFGGEFPSCREAEVCPAVSLPSLFASGGRLTARRVRSLLAAVPPYFSQAVITRDPDTGRPGNTANIAFGIRVMPLDDQQRLIDEIRAAIDPPGIERDPPPGTEARIAGLPAIAAQASSSMADSRYWLSLLGLLAVAVVLYAVYRSARRTLVPLVPIVLATGWSSLVLAGMDIPLNPMSATLGALVIAIATEFSVILSARYEEERSGGRSIGEALRNTYARTGAAVAASGTTAIVGFAALIASDIRMLRDFGFVTVIDLGVALAGVMLVLPAALVLAERQRGSDPRLVRERLVALLPARARR